MATRIQLPFSGAQGEAEHGWALQELRLLGLQEFLGTEISWYFMIFCNSLSLNISLSPYNPPSHVGHLMNSFIKT